jgi:hypothetical protein
MANRRLSRRIPFRKRVRYGLHGVNSSGYTVNISRNGVGIESHRVFPPRSIIEVHIYMDGKSIEDGRMDEIIVAKGVVAWVSPTLPGIHPKMGIAFTTEVNGIDRILQNRY